MIDRNHTIQGELTELMSDPTNDASYRKQLRFRVALLTGLMTMRDELETDIAELTGQLATPPAPNGRIAAPPALLPGAAPQYAEHHDAGAGESRRADLSKSLKKRWASFKAGQGPSPKQPRAKRSPNGESKKHYSAHIGEGTNGDFIYKYAAAHGDVINVKEATAAAGKTAGHKNLVVRGRMTVAVAEMKRKGFLTHEPERGYYRLTPLAHQIRQLEQQ